MKTWNCEDEDEDEDVRHLDRSWAWVWFGLVWFGLVWFGLVWFASVWTWSIVKHERKRACDSLTPSAAGNFFFLNFLTFSQVKRQPDAVVTDVCTVKYLDWKSQTTSTTLNNSRPVFDVVCDVTHSKKLMIEEEGSLRWCFSWSDPGENKLKWNVFTFVSLCQLLCLDVVSDARRLRLFR